MIDIGIKLKALRLERDLKQSEIAEKVNIKQNTLSQFENNKGRPSYEVLVKFCKLYGVTADYLLGLVEY